MDAIPKNMSTTDIELEKSAGEADTAYESLDVDVPLPKTRFLEELRSASKLNGRSIGSIFREIVRFQMSRNRVTDSEYFKYRIFDDSLYGDKEKREFIGSHRNYKIHKSLRRISRTGPIVDNKYYLEIVLKGLGLSGTTTLARFGSVDSFPETSVIRSIRTEEDLVSLVSEAKLPIFGKPVGASLSLGTIGIAGYDQTGKLLSLTNGRTIKLSRFFDQISENYRDMGYVFQEMIQMHPKLRKYTGSAVGTFRVVTIRKPDGIDLLYSTWKIPSKNSMADNFWRYDNLIAQIDEQTGEVLRCQKGTGTKAEEVSTLPGTDLPIVGITMPMWTEVRNLALNVASVFPDNRILGFDIGLSGKGPVMIEGNTNPDHGLYQIAAAKGFLGEENRKLVEWNMADVVKKGKAMKKRGKARLRAHTKQRIASRLRDFGDDMKSVGK